MSRILVVDDEPAIGWSLREMLTDEGHAVDLAATIAEGLAAAARTIPDVILLDVRLPGRDGIDAIPDLRAVTAAAPVVVMTAFGDLGTAVRAVRAGAFDFLVKPFELDHVAGVIARAIVAGRAGGKALDPDATPATLIGSSSAMQVVFKQIAVIAASDRPAMVTGPSGSGKSLVARAIHDHGPRHDAPFVATSLRALAPTAHMGELFTPGSGLLDRAAGGTLFVNDIACAPDDVQERLVAMLDAAPSAGVRLIAGSGNRPTILGLIPRLAERLRSLVVEVPSLADRSADLEPLVRGLLDRHAAEDRGFLRQVTDAHAGALVHRQGGDVAAVQGDGPGIDRDQAGDHVEAGGLAGAVGAQQAGHLAATQPQAHALDHGTAAERLADVVDHQAFRWDGFAGVYPVRRVHDGASAFFLAG
jgi:two-component system nitrogen regulation response regulator GlnG